MTSRSAQLDIFLSVFSSTFFSLSIFQSLDVYVEFGGIDQIYLIIPVGSTSLFGHGYMLKCEFSNYIHTRHTMGAVRALGPDHSLLYIARTSVTSRIMMPAI